MTTSDPTPKPARRTTAETYALRQNHIARLMDVLQMELDRQAEEAKAKPSDWGFAGSLGKVSSDLIEAVTFVSGKTREGIEALLDDAK